MVNIQLHLGDCLEFMKTLPDGSVDAVITDPPYGVGLEYGGQFVDDENYLFGILPSFIREAERISKLIIFPSGKYEVERWLMQNYPPRWRMCWYKGSQSTASPIGFSDFELMFVYGKDIYRSSHDYFYIRTESDKRIGHPCPKPQGWAEWLISRLTKRGDTVLDCFMGSGTTGMVCVKTGRNFIGCEIDSGYFKIAEKRIAEAQLQISMFQI